ncbi:MAG TPA: hypothetical protein VG942_18305 [Hyphomonadaceae bacterium]|nr:hypothetical protein [Hyphomonadaceae bacterium]
MRFLIFAVVVLAPAGCGPSSLAADGAKSAGGVAKARNDIVDTSVRGGASLKAAIVLDNESSGETPDGYTFHTHPAKVEKVYLPAAPGESWAITVSDPLKIEIGQTTDEKTSDGTVQHVVRVMSRAIGDGTVRFERHEGTDPAIAETRTINFMAH